MKSTNNKKSLGLRLNFWLLRLTRNWLRVALVVVGLYASLPFVAPALMKLGATGPANILYTLYSPFCHQFAFRSVFLFGEQPFYPREITDTPYQSYESYIAELPGFPAVTSPEDFSPSFWQPARAFRGNEEMGYKTTLCARDVSIYAMLFAGGLIYAYPPIRRRIRPIPLWIYVIAGLGPIGIDGFSQLLSYPPFNLWEVRETAPFFRVATGAMFGLMNAWLGYPYIEMTMQDTRRQIEIKLYRAGIRIE